MDRDTHSVDADAIPAATPAEGLDDLLGEILPDPGAATETEIAAQSVDDSGRPGRRGLGRRGGHASSTELLVAIALKGILPRRAVSALRAGRPIVITLIVPSPAWIRPVESVLRRIGSGVQFVTRSSAPRPSVAADLDADAAERVADGRALVAIAADPAWIAPVLRAAADHTLAIPPLDAERVERAIQAWCGRRPHPGLAPADLTGLDLPDLAAALRPASRAAACRERIIRASRARVAPPAGEPATPLNALTGYGEAQAWAIRTAADIARVRRGELSADMLEGAVLHGPPGTGKTTLARALAGAAGVVCAETSVGAWFAGSPGYLDSICKQISQFCDHLELCAKQDGCSIGFIDELDALPSRTNLDGRSASWWNTVITFVAIKVETLRKSGVVLVAATNHLDRIDPALLRPGRFDRQFPIAPPDEAGRLGILRNHLGNDLDGVDLTPAARLSGGMTGAVLAAHVRSARRRASQALRPMRLDDLTAEIAPADQRPAAHLKAVARHEAGHAMLGHRLGLDVEHVTLQGGTAHAGMTLLRLPDPIPDRAGLERRVVAVLGGRAADIVLGAGPTAGASADLREATRLLAALHGCFGLGATIRAVIDQEHADHLLREDPSLAGLVEADLRRLQGVAVSMVRADRAAIADLVAALVADRIVTGEEVSAIAAAHRPRYRVSAAARPRGTCAAGASAATGPTESAPGSAFPTA